MRKIIISVSILVALFVVPFEVSAQGLRYMPSLPSFGLPANVSLGNLSLYGGWTTNAGMTKYVAYKGNPTASLTSKAEWDYEYSSFYTAATLPVSVGDYGAAIISGSLALPSASPGRESFYDPTGVLSATRRWSADTYWATLEAIWAYPLSGTFTALTGFRWVNWQTSYKSPINELGPYAPTDTADVTVNGYVPFVGLLVTYGDLNVGAIGLPTTVGELEHNESFGLLGLSLKAKGTFTGGYFFEMFADYKLPLPGGLGPGVDADLSLFSKCSFLEVIAQPTLRWGLGGGFTEEDYDFRLQRNLFVVGAKATLNFNIAGLLPF
jgi:hypothetical protein